MPCRLLFAVVYKRIGKMQIYCIVIRLSVLITLLLVMLQFSLRFLANFSDTVAFPPDCTTPAYPPFDCRGADRRPRAHDRFAQAVPQLITTLSPCITRRYMSLPASFVFSVDSVTLALYKKQRLERRRTACRKSRIQRNKVRTSKAAAR